MIRIFTIGLVVFAQLPCETPTAALFIRSGLTVFAYLSFARIFSIKTFTVILTWRHITLQIRNLIVL